MSLTTDYATILDPKCDRTKKGILVWTNTTIPNDCTSPYKVGLKSGEQLKKEHIDFGRTIYHPFIFFRAPYFNNPIDYTSPKTELKSLYGPDLDTNGKIFIRVDPNLTRVFSSEIRAAYSVDSTDSYSYRNPVLLVTRKPMTKEEREERIQRDVLNSSKSLTKYFSILSDNRREIIEKSLALQPHETQNKKWFYNLYSSRAVLLYYNKQKRNDGNILGIFNDTNDNHERYPNNSHNIAYNSEILVKLPVLHPKFFVKVDEC
jgi:hypothetical protein